ncbi:MAG: hypothetical protein H0T89_07635 [Deltaproteobacteria bacterium]|nr:hypothetical protein [Deltaproteobacteria bacterium]
MVARAFTIIAAISAACASSRPGAWKPVTYPKSERTIEHWTLADEDEFVRRTCENVIAPTGKLRCDSLKKFGLSSNKCGETLSALRPAGSDRERNAFRLVLAGLSLADSCDEVDAAFRIAASAARGDRAITNCKKRPDGSYDLSSEDVLLRRGLGDRVFGDTISTVDSPIQVCGLMGEVKYLTRLTCADGSRPWPKDLDKAHAARQAAETGTSRCGELFGKPVDRYKVPCPEKTYEVFIDMYECGPGEELWDGVRKPGG